MGGGRAPDGASGRANYDPAIDVAFICTGNICRSPMAEAILRARLATVAPDVVVGSAGLLFDGRAAEPDAVKTLSKRGLDLRTHAAQTISADLLADTALILGMERRHVREVSDLHPSLFVRSFTLPEFVRLATVVGPRPEGIALRPWVEHIGGLRNPDDYRFADRSSEIEDPYHRSMRAFRACADELDARIDELVSLAWPTTRGGPVARAASGGTHADRDRR